MTSPPRRPPPPPLGSPVRLAALLFSCLSTPSAVPPLLSLLSTRTVLYALSFSPASFGNSSVSTSCCFPSPLCPSPVLLRSVFFFSFPSIHTLLAFFFFISQPPLTHYEPGSIFSSDPWDLTATSLAPSLSHSVGGHAGKSHSQIEPE